MDSVFHLEDLERAAFLEQMMQAFDSCVYICLRYYLPPPNNCLKGFDGIYRERRNQESTSSSLATHLFHVYRDSSAYPPTGLIPGLAFATNNPYMKLELHEFQRLVSSDFQLQFYLEAGIKTVVLMGCATGEIELGFCNHPQVDVETEMKNLIQINFPPHSSSSSSLRSLSVDSPEYPSLLFNTSAPPFLPQETVSAPPQTASPHEQALSRIRNAQFPSIETENAAMTNAILAVLSSSSSPPSTSSSIPTAFRRYRPNSAPPRSAAAGSNHSRFKRAVLFFRNLNQLSSGRPEFPVQVNRPTDTQLHHMISERRRRERLNESFHILRSFLPPGTKKDKASVLSSTAEYMRSLKSQVAELKKRNMILESQLKSESSAAEAGSSGSSSSGERVSVEVVQVSSSSGARFLDLRVRVRGESRLLDLVMRLTEFLKGQNNVSLTSVESNTRMLGSVAVHVVMMRLRIEGDEFDESGFREAVRRNIGDDDE